MFALFCFLIFIFLPFAFFDSGGGDNNVIGYIFLVLIGMTYLFEGWRRIFLVTGLVLMFMLLHTLEHFYPQLVMVYPSASQFWDRLFQIPMLLVISFLIILQFGKEYKRVNRKLHEMANLDVLTGLYNRRKFNTAIEEALTGQHGSAFLVLLDLDNFKKINDLCGHAAGDAVLQQLAQFLLGALDGGQNIVSRWGGDEFAIIYYGDAALLRQKLAAMKADFAAYVAQYNPTTDISYSIEPIENAVQVDDLLVRADHLLYAEKLHKRG
ncbi:MAG: GGDEF domain-containing protein [Pygmaiobacter sp.]|nr:GGDEF domain-containing protein [Pygmaiobacter sp.]